MDTDQRALLMQRLEPLVAKGNPHAFVYWSRLLGYPRTSSGRCCCGSVTWTDDTQAHAAAEGVER